MTMYYLQEKQKAGTCTKHSGPRGNNAGNKHRVRAEHKAQGNRQRTAGETEVKYTKEKGDTGGAI